MKIKLYDLKCEQALLGVILRNPICFSKARSRLTHTDFAFQKHQILFEAFTQIADQGDPIEPVAISNELEKKGLLEKAGGEEYLFDLAQAVGTSAALDYYIKTIKETKMARDLLELTDKIKQDLHSMTPPQQILSHVRDTVIKVSTEKNAKVIPLRDAIQSTVKHIEKLSESEDRLTGIPSGFTAIDRFTGGWQRGELIILAGRPGMGKSILGKDFAEASGVPVAYFTLEMAVYELVKRELAGKGQINFEALRTGMISGNTWGKILEAAQALFDVPIYYIDMPNITIDELIGISENLKMTKNIDLVVIDYLQLIRPKSRLEIREREVSEVSRKLKNMARSLEIPVICIAQLNRQCEARDNKRPRLSDLRESGSLEQDADIVAFIYRDNVYNSQAPKDEAEFILAKGRNIRTGKIALIFEGAFQRFKNPEF